jgi:integrase
MCAINEQIGTQPDPNVTMAEFWENTYLPFVTEKKRHSTVYGYKKLWASNLKQHFGTRTLAEYRTADGYKYLESLTKDLGRNSLQHVRSLASGIFTRAVNLGLIDTNPWSAVRLQESRAPEPTVAYTLKETLAIRKALSGLVNADLVFSLAAFLGMRPSEIAGLRWEDVTDEEIYVRQAVVRGIAGDTKTPQSQRTLPLLEPVRSLIAAYHKQCAGISEGWLFQSRAGGPVKMESFIKHKIMPAVREAELPWYGLYAARRACATNLVALTGNVNAAHQVLGNSLAVAMKAYIKPSAEAGLAGLKLLEAAATNAISR